MPELGDGFMPWAYHAFWERMSAQCKKICRESSTSIWSHHVFLEPPATKSPQLQVESAHFARFRALSKSVPGTLPMLIGQTCPASSSQGDRAWTPQRAPSRRRHIRRRGRTSKFGVSGIRRRHKFGSIQHAAKCHAEWITWNGFSHWFLVFTQVLEGTYLGLGTTFFSDSCLDWRSGEIEPNSCGVNMVEITPHQKVHCFIASILWFFLHS